MKALHKTRLARAEHGLVLKHLRGPAVCVDVPQAARHHVLRLALLLAQGDLPHSAELAGPFMQGTLAGAWQVWTHAQPVPSQPACAAQSRAP